MPPLLEIIDDLCQAITRGAVHQVGSVHQAAKFAAQTFRCHHIYARLICPGFHAVGCRTAFSFLILLGCFSAHLHECHEPILTKTGLQGVQRGGGGFLEVEGLAQLQNIFRGEILVGNFKVKISVEGTKIRACTQSNQPYPCCKLLFESTHRLTGIRRGAWGTILIVHVKNQGGSIVGMDQPRQDHPRQEGLARASRAKNPR